MTTVDFQPKTFLILYPSLENSTTGNDYHIECTHSWVWQLSFFHAFILICWSSKLIWSIVLITDLIETLLRNLSTLETCQLTSKPNRFYCHKNNFTSTTFQLDILQNGKRNIIKFFIEKLRSMSIKFHKWPNEVRK